MNESREHSPVPADALRVFDQTSRHRPFLMENVDLLGVVGDVKPLALVVDRDNLQPLLGDMNLRVHSLEPRSKTFRAPILAVSKSSERIDELVAASTFSEEERHRTIGQLLGYPVTATDYFLRRFDTIGTPGELPMIIPDWIDGTVDEQLHSFILSPDHYQAEMAAYIDPLHDAVRTHGPETYRELERRARAVRRRKTAQRVLGMMGRKTDSAEPYAIQRVRKR